MENTDEKTLGEGYASSAVNHRGIPAEKSSTGGWRSAWFIIGVEVAERFAYFGIGSNLINYLTGHIGLSTAAASANVNAWVGTGAILPVLGAFVADAYLGRFRTIVVSSLIYVVGMASLTLSAFMNPIIKSKYRNHNKTEAGTSPSSLINVIFFFFSLYLVAVGQSGHKPCVQAFGADQFDVEDEKEKKARSSFFNWWYLSLSAGINLAILIVVYVQDNVSWALGFAIPCLTMMISLVVFIFGKRTYRFSIRNHVQENAFARISRVFIVAFKNRRLSPGHAEMEPGPSHRRSDSIGFLRKALLSSDAPDESANQCSARDVEDATALIRLIPFWITTLPYAIAYSQFSTLFTKQGMSMDRDIFPGVKVSPASLQILIGLSIIVLVPFYDRVFVPIARSFTKETSGIKMLQRIGTGMIVSAVTMVVAALVEAKRLKTAREHGLTEQKDAMVPMSIWWLIPQYLLLGLADVFTLIGMQEFFYSQVPTELRSIGLALYSSVLGVGSILSGVLISVIDSATIGAGGLSWFDDNLNKAHLDYFYWLLAALSAVGFCAFLFPSRSYVYNQRDGA
ncbi:PREDICTED: protein NRT1/ PTR FAMILY 5.14-like [Tarenaya hassleriana]|uniref:protein NRT1/ PTR FAMILY 5.14-like n=1 Tax=Tarenaya hassleriana TaxID=28532 RepID=UPI00053C26F8|nr:PREDICTED: protein NRT1/ PTR FAMILY 5.14-like [Tarenaya hassleriana]XP_010521167.1 PREDICTED: protein NRT1/ PTR FAMILY 5.14-like [Tarenaya hassleriana]